MGSQSSQSTSRPLTGPERLDAYRTGMSAISGADSLADWQKNNPNASESDYNRYVDSMFKTAGYQAPTYERLGEGDYATLRSGLEAPIDRAKQLDLQATDQAMSDRGIYTSLNALRGRNDVSERYAPQYAAVGAALTEAKQKDIAGANAAALENAKLGYESKWRPADYKAGIFNNTGGVISSGGSGGWSI